MLCANHMPLLLQLLCFFSNVCCLKLPSHNPGLSPASRCIVTHWLTFTLTRSFSLPHHAKSTAYKSKAGDPQETQRQDSETNTLYHSASSCLQGHEYSNFVAVYMRQDCRTLAAYRPRNY